MRNTKEFLIGVIYIAIGATVMYLGQEYDMGTAGKMGAAYFPTILSACLMLIGVVSLIRSLIRQGTPMGAFALKGLLLVIGSIVLFGLLVRTAGLLVALPLLVIISSYASSRFRWPQALAMAAGVTVFCILVFKTGLGVPLPILGSWFGQ